VRLVTGLLHASNLNPLDHEVLQLIRSTKQRRPIAAVASARLSTSASAFALRWTRAARADYF
jgi:hypothetical protein